MSPCRYKECYFNPSCWGVGQNPGLSGIEELKVMMGAMLGSQKELKTRIDNLVSSQKKLELTVNSKISE